MNYENLIIGYGYIGKQVADICIANHQSVAALVRRQQESKIPLIIGDLDSPQSLSGMLTNNINIYYFAPPSDDNPADTRMHNFLHALESTGIPKRIEYISTTAVYGDADGQWIDEDTPLKPETERGQRRLSAEQQLQRWCTTHNCEYLILRVVGIYGPGKLPIERIRQGMSVLLPDIAPPSNRIHAHDLTRICFQAMQHTPSNAIYNVSDGHPSSMSDYFIKIAELAGLPPPKTVDWQEAKATFSKGMLDFLSESKKVSNRKLLDELNYKFAFPDLDRGLRDIFNKI